MLHCRVRSTRGIWLSVATATWQRISVAEYAAGSTPIPCLRWNEKIKFAAVLDKALALGFTGESAWATDI